MSSKDLLINFFLDLLFPKKCLVCEKDKIFLCQKCLSKIKLNSRQRCPICEKITTPKGTLCEKCKKSNSFLNSLISVTNYEEPLKKIIHTFKYFFIKDLGIPLGKLMEKSIRSNNLEIPQIIAPIPLHPIRERWRGFNQAEIISQYLCQKIAPGIHIDLFLGLKRNRFTKPQMKIKSYKKRRTNIKGAFSLENSTKIKGKNILLVDDIATTGATIFECAQILKENGAKKVSAIVLARQKI